MMARPAPGRNAESVAGSRICRGHHRVPGWEVYMAKLEYRGYISDIDRQGNRYISFAGNPFGEDSRTPIQNSMTDIQIMHLIDLIIDEGATVESASCAPYPPR